jgi:hypothetical protein
MGNHALVVVVENSTPSTLIPWLVAAGLVVAWLLARAWTWAGSRYEVTAVSPWRFRFRLRWYSTGSRVLCSDCGDVYDVRDMSDDGTAVPWVLISNTSGDADDIYWCPVTDCTPLAVRRLRPRLLLVRYGPVPVPWPFLYRYEPAPVYAVAAGPGKNLALRRHAGDYFREHPDSGIGVIDGKDTGSPAGAS